MEKEKNSVMVELYDLSITQRKDDRFGRVVTPKSLTEDDLIHRAVLRRTDLNPTTLRASMEILKEIATEELANGASVYFGLGFFHLSVNGTFIGDQAKWDPAVHSLRVNVTPSIDVRTAVKNVHVNMMGMAHSGLVINSVFDVASGEENTRLTPGGGVNITGSKIRIAGDKPGNGIHLINQATDVKNPIPAANILRNDPSAVSFICPAGLPAGDYKLSLTTQFSNAQTILKDPRTYVFDYVLVV